MDKGVNVRDHGGSSTTKTRWKMRDAKERGDTYCDRSYATKTERRRGGPPRTLQCTSQKPNFCLGGSAAESGSVERRWLLDGWREQELNFMLVSYRVVSERLAPSGACVFSSMLSGVHRLAVRADMNWWVFPPARCATLGFSGRRRSSSLNICVANVALE